MTAFALSPYRRDGLAPPRPPGMGAGLALALAAHVLLILALAWSVNWKTSEPEGVVAELWSATPQIAAPRAVEPPPPQPVVTPQPPPPQPRPEPVVAPPPQADAQISIEREKAKKLEAERKADDARKAEAAKKAEAERQHQADELEKKKLAEDKRRDEAKQAAIREANLRRMMSQAGTSDDPAATGTAARTSGPSAGYAGRIKAYLRPFIKTAGSLDGKFSTTVEVRTSPDGTIIATRITQPSGSATWDDRVMRALDSARSLPRDTDGRVPSPMLLVFNSDE